MCVLSELLSKSCSHTVGSVVRDAVLARLRWFEPSKNTREVSEEKEDSAAEQLQKMYWEILRHIESCACRVHGM
jgi:hypothetical protein